MSSSEELVEELDEAGIVIGVVTRRAMRERRLPHRCVYVLVFNGRGELFIHQRTGTKDVYPSYWDCTIGGVLAAGETFADGAGREGEEELGVPLEPEELFPFRFADAAMVVWGMVYRARHGGPFQLQAEEIVRGEFVTLDELEGRAARDSFCPDGLAVLAEYRKFASE